MQANTLQSDPSLTLRLAPDVAATLVTATLREPLHTRELPSLHLANSADLRPIRTLGEGGMGRVLLANQESLDREVAVKSALHADTAAAHALILEAVITGKLEHPNIPPVHQLGRDNDGNPMLVMKRIEGARWSELLADKEHPVRSGNPLFLRDEENAHLEILMQVSSALHYAHSRGVFHRDVKPDNVMIGPFGEVYLIDWGVAWADSIHPHVETEKAIVGSPAYMAPELVWGERPDARTDVYLLGATLHQVLTGRYRHDASTSSAALKQAAISAPFEYGDDVPAELAALCNRATRPKRDERPESAFDFVQALRRYLTHRASIELTRRAASLLEENTTECRFAVDEALRRWPENAEARDLRTRLFTKMIEEHLREESPAAARALATEVGDASFDEQIAALESRLAERKRLEQRALDAERDADLTSGQRVREWFLGFMVLVVIARGIIRVYHPLDKMSPTARYVTLLEVALLLFLPPILGALFASKWIAHTAAGRAILGTLAAVGAGLIVNRAVGLVYQPSIPHMLFSDCVLVAVGFLIASFRQGRWLVWGTVAAACTGAGVLLMPTRAPSIMNIGALFGVAVILVGQRLAVRR